MLVATPDDGDHDDDQQDRGDGGAGDRGNEQSTTHDDLLGSGEHGMVLDSTVR